MLRLNSAVLENVVAPGYQLVNGRRSRQSRWSRCLYLDIVKGESFVGIVLRGGDKHVIGATKSADDAELIWNDQAGAHREFLIATCDDESEAKAVVAEVFALYVARTEDDNGIAPVQYGEQVSALSANGMLLMLALTPVFGALQPQRGMKPFAAVGEERAQKAQKSLESARGVLSAIRSNAMLAGADVSPDDIAAVEALIARMTKPKAQSVA